MNGSSALYFRRKIGVLFMNIVKLQFSDGRPNAVGLEEVNAVLRSVGVRASTVSIPDAAKPILKASQSRTVTEAEQEDLIKLFSLNRAELLEQIELAGRVPETPRGGLLSTRQPGVAPYPKVYDMLAIPKEHRAGVLESFGRFHVNMAENGVGIDEVMTVVSGGPFTWMFVLPEGVVVRLTVGPASEETAIRLSYPGMGIHAGYMDAKQGLIVAYAHGPEEFVVHYDEPTAPHANLLNTNPWVDFSGGMPTLFDKIH